MTERRTAVVFAGGPDPLRGTDVESLSDTAALVIAADSGVDHASAAGVNVDILVGDLDSASPDALRAAEAAGVEIEQHPADKDKTDLEIAIDTAQTHGVDRVVVVASGRGRFDHLLSSMLVLAAPTYRDLTIEARVNGTIVHVVHDHIEFDGSPGELVTLLPASTHVTGVSTQGLRWPLCEEDLTLGSSRGVSNELVTAHADVRIASGTLFVIRPTSEAP